MQYYFPKEKFFRLLYFLFGIILVWNFYFYLLPYKNTVVHNLFALAYATPFILAGVIGIIGVRILTFKNRISKALIFLSAGTLAYAVGLLILVYFHVVLTKAVPFPSLADWFFLAFYPFVAIAMYFILRAFVTVTSKTILLETMLIAAASMTVVYLGSKIDVLAKISPVANIVSFGYLIGDVVLIAITYIMIRLSSRKTEPSVILIIASLLFQTASHLMFTYRLANGIYWIGDISDLLAAFSGFAFCLAVINIIDRTHRNATY